MRIEAHLDTRRYESYEVVDHEKVEDDLENMGL
jgi:hypothetical protein